MASLHHFEQHLPELLNGVYDAALDASLWPAVLTRLAEIFGGGRGIVHLLDPRSRQTPSFISFGTQPEFVASYLAHYALQNPYPLASFLKLPEGHVMFSGQIIDEVAVAETEFYNDWMKPQGVPLNHLGVLLNRSSDTVAVLALAPASKTYERDASDYATALKMLVPHFKRALLFNRKLGHLETAHASLKAVFESVASPAFVVDASCRLIECNSAAQAFLKGGKSLKFRSGIVTAQTLRPSLAELVGRVLATHRPEAMLLPEENGDLYCWIMPLRKETDAHVPCQPTHLLILLTTPSKRPLMTADQLGRLWRLTSAEARLAEALVQGSTLREYAAATGVSLNTVRNQCTAIFTKTGVTRQSELVNLIGAAQRAAGAWHHE